MTKQEKEEQNRIEKLDRENRLKSVGIVGSSAKEQGEKIVTAFHSAARSMIAFSDNCNNAADSMKGFGQVFENMKDVESDPIILHECLQVKFEAFGQVHTVYTEIQNMGLIHPTIEKICGTVFIHEPVSTVLVSEDIFENNNLKIIRAWNEKIVNRMGNEI